MDWQNTSKPIILQVKESRFVTAACSCKKQADISKDLCLNIEDPKQYLILWKTGKLKYTRGSVYPLEEFAFQEWCTQNFGTRWND